MGEWLGFRSGPAEGPYTAANSNLRPAGSPMRPLLHLTFHWPLESAVSFPGLLAFLVRLVLRPLCGASRIEVFKGKSLFKKYSQRSSIIHTASPRTCKCIAYQTAITTDTVNGYVASRPGMQGHCTYNVFWQIHFFLGFVQACLCQLRRTVRVLTLHTSNVHDVLTLRRFHRARMELTRF